MARHLASRIRAKRLARNFSQQTLASRSGVSLGVLKLFECTGKISLGSLLKLAFALEALGDCEGLFEVDPPVPASLDALLKAKERKRGRS
jgi:transcriptional regulator with XRE-family HTH domain